MSATGAVASPRSVTGTGRRLGKVNARAYTVSQRVARIALAVLSTLVLAFLVAPIVIVCELTIVHVEPSADS